MRTPMLFALFTPAMPGVPFRRPTRVVRRRDRQRADGDARHAEGARIHDLCGVGRRRGTILRVIRERRRVATSPGGPYTPTGLARRYFTADGAGVGDLFMSLIHTCELNGVNPFDYLTELQRHAEELKRSPAEWMPWNYRETLARLATPAAA
jgi:hypothetical protein